MLFYNHAMNRHQTMHVRLSILPILHRDESPFFRAVVDKVSYNTYLNLTTPIPNS